MQQLLFENTNSKEFWFHKEGCKYYIVDTEAKLSRMCDILISSKMITLDIETTGLDIGTCDIIGVSFCPEVGLAFYVPLGHYGDKNISIEMFKSYLSSILESIPICGHNLKFDYKFMYKKLGIKINCKHDTFIIAKLLDEFDACKLKYLGEVLFDFNVVELTELMAQYNLKVNEGNMLKTEEMFEYACQDVDLTLRLFLFFWKKMDWRPDFIYELEIGLIYSIAAMETRGVKVDYKFLLKLRKEYEQKINGLATDIKKILGVSESFNIDSNQKFGKAIISKFPAIKKKLYYTEKTGAVKLDDTFVKKYIVRFDEYLEDNELPKDMNFFRLFNERKSMYNLLTKYLISWIERVEYNKSTTIYTNFNSLGPRTGRMSSNDPNMQNVAPKIRRAIVPRKGYYFLSMDYDQVEYRILAGMANLDHLLKEMNIVGSDVHAIAASLLFNVDLDALLKGIKAKDPLYLDLRKRAKTLNFGLIYGMGIPKLAEALGISEAEAEELSDLYKERFLKGTDWFERVKTFAKKKGYVLTAYGRKRRIDNLNFVFDPYSSEAERKEIRRLMGEAYRQAINTPIQGTSADVTKIGLNKVDNFINREGLDIHPVLVIHDEYIFEVSNKYSEDDAFELLRGSLEVMFKDKVKLTVDKNMSTKSWGAIKD
jgi:DNA polymerase-1